MSTSTCLPTINLDEMHFLSLQQVAYYIRTGQLSPVTLTEHMLTRIRTVDARLNSYLFVTEEEALQAAHKAASSIEQGNYLGPLHGVPVALKDNCFTQGIQTSGGLGVESVLFPDYDATVVARLKSAGAVVLGKLNLTEGSLSGYNVTRQIPVNPWRKDLWAGVSSSGSGVATAAGLCFAAVGSDTGGSIRLPAMANGVVGLKPTYGRVSRYGVLPVSSSLDHIGVLTRRTIDAAMVLECIAGHDPKDSTSLEGVSLAIVDQLSTGVSGLKVGVDEKYGFEGVDPVLVKSIKRTATILQGLGAEIIPVKLPEWTDVSRKAFSTICGYETAYAHRHQYLPGIKNPLSAGMLRDCIALGKGFSKSEYQRARVHQRDFARLFHQVFSSVDAVICSSGGVPFPFPKKLQYGSLNDLEPLFKKMDLQFLEPANFSGIPSLSVRSGFTPDGLPLTVQLLGPHLGEAILCRLGHAIEESTEWYKDNPFIAE